MAGRTPGGTDPDDSNGVTSLGDAHKRFDEVSKTSKYFMFLYYSLSFLF